MNFESCCEREAIVVVCLAATRVALNYGQLNSDVSSDAITTIKSSMCMLPGYCRVPRMENRRSRGPDIDRNGCINRNNGAKYNYVDMEFYLIDY